MIHPQTLTPVWDTDTVWEESFMFMREENGVAEAPFLYTPTEILKVTSSDGATVYEEGVDWVLADGKLRLTEDSRIHAYTYDELYPKDKPAVGGSFPMNDRFLLFGEDRFFLKKQIAVTYICARGGWDGPLPQLADKELPRTFELLRGGKSMNLILYGDSITRGANNTEEQNVYPFQPCYGRMLHHALCEHYGEQITYVNTAVGGKDSNRAVAEVEERVNAHNPDLVVLAFGMNDGAKEPEAFEANIRTIIERVRAKHPACEFILVATSLPNAMLTDPKAPFWGNQRFFKERLDAIAADTAGTVVANIRDVHKYLLTRKRFMDLTSNQVNHPNDFFYRIHAQFLAGMLID